jgi:hypothetical protein
MSKTTKKKSTKKEQVKVSGESQTSPTEQPADDTVTSSPTQSPAPTFHDDGFTLWEGKLYKKRANRFFGLDAVVPLKSLNIEAKAPEFSVTCPKIPWSDWCQIVSFHRWCVKTFNAETHISHLLTSDNKFIHCPFHQQVRRGAMTIHVNYASTENQEILRRLNEEYGVSTGDFHGTTHNHVTAAAFESGTDKSDEEFKQGFHFTLGKLNMPVVDIHARVRVIIPAQFDEEGNRLSSAVRELIPDVKDIGKLIEIPGWDPSLSMAVRQELSKYWTCRTPQLQRVIEVPVEGQVATPDDGFPEEWKDYIVELPATTYSPGKYYGGAGTYSSPQSYTTSGGSVREIIAKVFDYTVADVSNDTRPRNGEKVVSYTSVVDDLDSGELEDAHTVWSDHQEYIPLLHALAAARESSYTLSSLKNSLRTLEQLQVILSTESDRSPSVEGIVEKCVNLLTPAPSVLDKRFLLAICRHLQSAKDWPTFTLRMDDLSSSCEAITKFVAFNETIPYQERFVFPQPVVGKNLAVFNSFFQSLAADTEPANA